MNKQHEYLFEQVLTESQIKLSIFDSNGMPKKKAFKIDDISAFARTNNGSAYTMTMIDNDILLISKTAYITLQREIGEREV